MSQTTQTIGKRLRQYRTQKGYSQERLAEQAGLHPTYIGQIERGEKNLTVESLSRITEALDLPMSQLFEKIGGKEERGYPLRAYELVAGRPPEEQERLYGILEEICRLKDGK